MIAPAYITGSRLGGWYLPSSDLDIVIPGAKPDKFMWNGTLVCVSGAFNGNRWGRFQLGMYRLDDGILLPPDAASVKEYAKLKRRLIIPSTKHFLTEGKPCGWFRKNESRFAELADRIRDANN